MKSLTWRVSLTQQKTKSRSLRGLLRDIKSEDEVLVPYIRRFVLMNPQFEWVSSLGPKPSDDYFHPSSDTTMCPRLMYFERHPHYRKQLVKTSIGFETQTMFDLGNVLHDYYQALLMAMSSVEGFPYLLEAEVLGLSEEDWVKGHADGILRLADKREPLLEIKTVNSYRFMSLTSPLPYWEVQTRFYMKYQDKEETIVLVVNREDGRLKEFVIKRNDDAIQPIIDKFNLVREALLSEGQFDRLPNYGDLESCKSCRAKGLCLDLGATYADV